MQSIPEIAAQIVNNSLSNVGKDNSRTIFLVGSKSVVSKYLLPYYIQLSAYYSAKVYTYLLKLFFSGKIYFALFIFR